MSSNNQLIETIVAASANRLQIMQTLINTFKISTIAELGVYKGAFAEQILKNCPTINRYYLLDPWRNLDAWNKPANKTDSEFDEIYNEMLARTDFEKQKREILRGKTNEVIDAIPDSSLGFAYVDADHTLKGITIDLIKVYPKVIEGGWLGGDDFCPTIWQHSKRFEPSLVFPYAVYFAEAMNVPIYALPYNQFLIHKKSGEGFKFYDLAKKYGSTELLPQLKFWSSLARLGAYWSSKIRNKLG